jgi:RibD C-terminal domain
MATLQWQFTASLDGYMAGPGGDMSWLTRALPLLSAFNCGITRLVDGSAARTAIGKEMSTPSASVSSRTLCRTGDPAGA